ncbi:MAG: hypothetical protein LBK23_06995 [Oscillospiraceae bacterium]|jgi:hypothetical protein|nr:hypothetical protein [Oscillospiraceae bacterium]
MKNRIIIAFLIFSLAISILPNAAAYAVIGDYSEELAIVSVYNDIEHAELLNSDVIVVAYDELSLIADDAKSLVDADKILFITSPEESAEEIAETLSIPKSTVATYNDAVLIAYSIYKLGGNYVFANHYAVFGEEIVAGNNGSSLSETNNSVAEFEPEISAPAYSTESDFSMVKTLVDYNDEIISTPAIPIDPLDVLDVAIRAADDTKEFTQNIAQASTLSSGVSTQSATLPSTIADTTFNSTMTVYGPNNTTIYGTLNCSVYGYIKGNGLVNGTLQKIYDVLAEVKAYPNSGYKVEKYKTRIHCYYTDFINLQTTTIVSGATYNQSLSLSGSFGSSGGSGGGSFTTGWSYNANSQTITESIADNDTRKVEWTAKPVNPSAGASYDIAPGMRIASPTNKVRYAQAIIYCDAMIFGITIHANSLPVGGSF